MSERQNNRRAKSMGLDLRCQVQIPAGPLVSCVTWAKCFKTSSTYTVEMLIIPSSLGYGEGELTFVKHLGQRLHVVWTSLLLLVCHSIFISLSSSYHLFRGCKPVIASSHTVTWLTLLIHFSVLPKAQFSIPTCSSKWPPHQNTASICPLFLTSYFQLSLKTVLVAW